MRRKGLSIRQEVDGMKVRIEELEKFVRTISKHVDRLEDPKTQSAQPVQNGYYWAKWVCSPLRCEEPFVIFVAESQVHIIGARRGLRGVWGIHNFMIIKAIPKP